MGTHLIYEQYKQTSNILLVINIFVRYVEICCTVHQKYE